METTEALIIFVRNPVLGKVKTRIAATAGEEKALAVYNFLLHHTKKITAHLQIRKFVFYADEMNGNDIWNGYEKLNQDGHDLGDRMKSAFELLFKQGFERIAIIGSDCVELKSEDIEDAFFALSKDEVVIGPASDGGYYLLGMRSPLKDLFSNKQWSSESVLDDTLMDLKSKYLSFSLLRLLNDVDEEKDINFELAIT